MKKSEFEPCCEKTNNPSHSKQISRINRIIGQLEGIKKMIDNQRYCPEIMIQLKAVRSAIKSVESNILTGHLHSCVAESFIDETDKMKKIDEIKELFDKFHS